jgi:hypothetical protein
MNTVCEDCGFTNDADAKFCESCGTKLQLLPEVAGRSLMSAQPQVAPSADPAVEVQRRPSNASRLANEALDQGKRLAADVRAKIRAAHPHKLKAVAVIAATLVVWVLLELSHKRNAPPSGWNYLAWTTYLLTLIPLSCGAVLILVSGSSTPDWITKLSGWMDRRAAISRGSEGRFNRFVARPALWSYEALNECAGQVNDDMLRNGAKVAAYAFSIILFGLLLFWIAAIAISIVIFVVFAAVMMFVVDGVMGTSNSSRISGALKGGLRSSEGKVYSGTNVFNEQVTGRVDKDGNVYEGTNIFNEQKVGRVDADGNRFEGTNVFNEGKTGRTDADGNIYEGTNIFNEEKVGRIDKDGNVFEGTNVFNEKKTGRVEKKSE